MNTSSHVPPPPMSPPLEHSPAVVPCNGMDAAYRDKKQEYAASLLELGRPILNGLLRGLYSLLPSQQR